MNRILKLGAMLGFALAVGACESDPAATDGAARVSVLLTDAPGDLLTAEVEIREIYLQGDTDDDAGGRVVLFSGSEVFDLLELRNGVTAKLAEVAVPAGTYHQIRIIVGDATITTEGGATYSTVDGTLKCPSCAQSGLKVQLPGGGVHLEEGTQSLIVDFDVAQSFGHAAGKSGRWIMHPVIRASKAEASGSITGTVTLAEGVTLPTCGGAAIDLTYFVPTAIAGDVSISGVTDADGNLSLAFITPGAYTTGFLESVVFDNGETLTFAATPSLTIADVIAGDVADVDYLITGATCAAAPPPAA